MDTYLHELDADAALLMFAAGELPGEDHAELERQLADDRGLRGRLTSLSEASAVAQAALRLADDADPAPRQTAAARQAGRLIRGWHAAREADAPEALPLIARRVPRWWLYPSAAAALLLVGLIVWWGNGEANAPMHFRGPRYGPEYGPGMVDGRSWGEKRDELMTGEKVALLESPVIAPDDDDPADVSVALLNAGPQDAADVATSVPSGPVSQ